MSTFDALDEGRIGFMNTPNIGNRLGSWTWAADNGCYGSSYVGDEKWLAWLAAFPDTDRERCLFATAPDVVGDSQATLLRSRPWLPVLRDLGYKAAFVAQDGLTVEETPWDEFDALFIGGSTTWKLTKAYHLVDAAKEHGKWVHIGRVNSRRRYLAFASAGADSADGTIIRFGPDIHAKTVLGWMTHHAANPVLFS